MSWRPEDWHNPIGDFIPKTGKGQQWAFEQGADAMLEALKLNKSGSIHVDTIGNVICLSMPFITDLKGWIVFIPEDKK